MAFGSGIGAAGGLIQAISLAAPAGQYASQANGPVSGTAADNIFWQTNEVEARSAVNSLEIRDSGGQGGLLAARAGATDTSLAADDTGGLTTQDPATAVNQLDADISAVVHGLPANFGPGRGRWRAPDLARVSVEQPSWQNTGGQAGAGPEVYYLQFFIDPDGDGWGDILVFFHNNGPVAVETRAQFNISYNARS